MNWLEFGILALLIVVVAIVQTWGLVRVNLILAQQNRDQLAMIGALSGNPAAAALATQMSSDTLEMGVPRPKPRMHLAGSS